LHEVVPRLQSDTQIQITIRSTSSSEISIVAAIVEAGCAGGFVGGHLLGKFELAAILQVTMEIEFVLDDIATGLRYLALAAIIVLAVLFCGAFTWTVVAFMADSTNPDSGSFPLKLLLIPCTLLLFAGLLSAGMAWAHFRRAHRETEREQADTPAIPISSIQSTS
jgi:hypothetical protein